MGNLVKTSVESEWGLSEAAIRSRAPLLLVGEAGTGKRFTASQIHNATAPHSPFSAFDLATMPADSHEATLFGGPDAPLSGGSGTVYIASVSRMSRAAQHRLSTFLARSRSAQGAPQRLLVSSEQPLRPYMESGHVREDLFYALSTFTVEMAPLRDRPDDLRRLVIARCAEAGTSERGRREVAVAAWDVLLEERWPGNLAQLQAVMDACLAAPEALIAARHVRQALALHASTWASDMRSDRHMTLAEVVNGRIQDALRWSDGDAKVAAHALGVSRSTVYRRGANPVKKGDG